MKVAVCLFTVLTMLFASSPCFAAPEDKPHNEQQTTADAPSEQPAAEQDTQTEKQIKLGMRGDDVRIVQNLLMNAGFSPGGADGVFGNMTMHAVMEFQRSNHLPVDGIVSPAVLTALQRSGGEPSRYNRVLNMTATAYSAYDPGNGSYTARGSRLCKGLAAVDTRVIPLGTRLYIVGYGYAVADDTGGSIRGNRIDLAFNSHGEALQFGRKNVVVYVLD